MLAASKQPEEYLFSSRQSPKITTRRAEQLIKKAGEKAGIKQLKPETLRATAIITKAKKNTEQAKQDAGIKNIKYSYAIIKARGGDAA